MKYRKLRIAWSVVWGVVAISLVVLWVRSYSRAYHVLAHDSSQESAFGVESGGWEVAYNGVPKLSELHFNLSAEDTTVDELRTHFGFYFGQHPLGPGAWLFVVPIWATVLLAAALAPFSWNDRFRLAFNLRTLLIATTLIAVVL